MGALFLGPVVLLPAGGDDLNLLALEVDPIVDQVTGDGPDVDHTVLIRVDAEATEHAGDFFGQGHGVLAVPGLDDDIHVLHVEAQGSVPDGAADDVAVLRHAPAASGFAQELGQGLGLLDRGVG